MRRVLLPQHISDEIVPPGAVLRSLSGLSMGTSWTVQLLESATPGRAAHVDLQQGLQQQLDLVVAQMSHWSEDSDLGRFNRAEPGSWHSLPAAFCEVLGFAMQVAALSGGAYDPCAGALVNLWGFGPRQRYDQPGFQAPQAEAVALLLSQQRRRRLELDLPARRVRQPGGLLLDLSAIAKGYGVDRLARYLDSQGIQHYLVEVGGELRGAGSKPDGQPWWVMLEQVDGMTASVPDTAPHPQEMLLALHGLSVATSGDYRRFFQDEGDGARFSHTIDPRNGMPINNQLASVTVVHADCMAADAWSTALTVLGPEAGLALAEQQGLAARFLQRDGVSLREILSSQMLAMLDD